MAIFKKTTRSNILELPDTWEAYLRRIFPLYIYHRCKNKFDQRYGYGFYHDLVNEHRDWLEAEPYHSNIRLRNKNLCVYCNSVLDTTHGIGDHVLGKALDSVSWLVPCCVSCNASKGNRDLLYWWCVMKKRKIMDLKRDILAIYCRGQYQLLKRESRLHEKPTDEHLKILKQFKCFVFK